MWKNQSHDCDVLQQIVVRMLITLIVNNRFIVKSV